MGWRDTSAYLEGSTLWESIRNVIGDFRHRSRAFFMLGLGSAGGVWCEAVSNDLIFDFMM